MGKMQRGGGVGRLRRTAGEALRLLMQAAQHG